MKDVPPDIIRALDSPFPDPDGFRLLWFHSSQKQKRDAEDRREAIDRAVEELQQLKVKVEGSRSRLTTREGIAEKVEGILAQRGAQSWIRYTIDEARQETFRQEKRGRSGAQTRWRRTVFAPLQRHELSKGGKVAQVFLPEVTVLQKKILKFLGIPITRYRQDLE